MTSLGSPLARKRLMRITVLAAVFLAAVSMRMQAVRGWGFLILCFIVSSIGAFGFLAVKAPFQTIWSGINWKWKFLVVVIGITVVLATSFLRNRSTPDAAENDFLAVFGVLAALSLWGLYRLFSWALDAISARLAKR